MGALIAVEFVTSDGVMQGFHNQDDRNGFAHNGWGADYQDPDQAAKASEAMAKTDAYLFGRRTFDELARFWPSQPDENPMAAHLNRSPKYVVTHRDEELPWTNPQRLRGDLLDAVTRLRSEVGGDIVVLGSGDVLRQLITADLVDGFRLYVHPLVLGSGQRLFPQVDRPLRLHLDDVDRTSTGVVQLSYTTLR